MDYQYTLPLSYFKQLKVGQKTVTFDLVTAISDNELDDVVELNLRQGDTMRWDIAIPPGVSMVTWAATFDDRVTILQTNSNQESGKEETLWPMDYDTMNPKPTPASLPAVKVIKAVSLRIRPLKDIKLENLQVAFLIADAPLYEAWRVGGSPPPNTTYTEWQHQYENGILVSRFSDMQSGQYRVLFPKGTTGWDVLAALYEYGEESVALLNFDEPPVEGTGTQIIDPSTTLERLWGGEQMKAYTPINSLFLPLSSYLGGGTFITDRSRWLYIKVRYASGKALNVQSRIFIDDTPDDPDGPDYVPPPVAPFPKPEKPRIDFPQMLPFGDEFPPKTPNVLFINKALDLASQDRMLNDPLKNICVGAETGLDNMLDAILVSPYANTVNFKELYNKVITFGVFSRDMQTISSQMFGNAGDKELVAMPYTFALNSAPSIGTNIPTVNTLLSMAQYKQVSNYYGERSTDSCAAIRDMAGGLLQLGSEMLDKIGAITSEIMSIISVAGQAISKVTALIGNAVARLNQVMSDMIYGAIDCIKNIGDATEQLIRESTAGLIRSLNQLNPCASGVLLGDTLGGTPGILSPEMGELVREAPELYDNELDF